MSFKLHNPKNFWISQQKNSKPKRYLALKTCKTQRKNRKCKTQTCSHLQVSQYNDLHFRLIWRQSLALNISFMNSQDKNTNHQYMFL